ncbi:MULTISPECIES: MOP flippase family protein [Klebsiella pneumoniae complex]|uniref:MOP flippase family protein n=1 Tax=Klebsiella pneumoniae complex TaxID=3390273 RepID=UPI000E35A5AE|nr:MULTISPECIES: MOP flippase family protein [Klebsiella]HEP0867093.1 MOP flippase family protein [Klebsiella pneumoniae subsp. pneumoniae]AXS16657.1 colanic acid exporter [Klebsiella pneumoniae]KAB7531845.1 MOP flippase family protein [Klebsiella pneumoniae]MBA8324619.1 MOP flippase family protein [Klebsiella pneumoniae]MBL0830996.1 MOP flippase family protein [Klebsiella pneumoniae]
MGMLHNVKWVSLSQITKISCQLLGMVLFSRYLSAKEFGIMSMALVVVNFVNILRDLGSSAAIIQRDSVSEELKCSVFYLNLFFGCILLVLFVALAPFISVFFKEPELVFIIILLSLCFPINSSTAIHLSLLERESKFNLTAKVEIISSILALLIATIFVVNGGGIYSIVSQTIAYSLFSAIGFWFISGWTPKFIFSITEVKSILRFSSNLIGFNIINYFSRNSDQIIIGKFFNATLLGYYSLAYRIMLFPIQNITFVLTRSLYPILSRLQNDKKSSFDIYLNTLKTISIIIPPMMFGLAVVSKDFITVVFGEQWSPVSSILIWLAPTAILQSLISTTGSVFMSQGKTDLLLKISIYNAILQISSFFIGGFFSLSIMVKLYLGANILMFFPNMFLAISLLKGSFLTLLTSFTKSLFLAIIMAFFVYLLSLIPFFSEVTIFCSLILKITIGIVLYLFLLFLFERRFILSKINLRK